MVLNFNNFSYERMHPVDPPKAPAATPPAPSEPAPPKAGADDVKENGRSSGALAKSQSEAFLSQKGDETPKPRQTGLAVSSLWGGGPRPPGEAERIRDLSSTKRRWTVNEMET
jgi:hypothetical protein